MWTTRTFELPRRAGRYMTVSRGGESASVRDILEAWQVDAAFRASFNAALADVPFRAFRWETPGVTAATLDRPFECVLLDSPDLDRRPEPGAFAQHFETSRAVVTFANLSGDATLIVPCPAGDPAAYGHLAAFVRSAPDDRRHALWAEVGRATVQAVGDRPVWLSTAGAGVTWLHVRLDRRPKYYGHAPYRREPS